MSKWLVGTSLVALNGPYTASFTWGVEVALGGGVLGHGVCRCSFVHKSWILPANVLGTELFSAATSSLSSTPQCSTHADIKNNSTKNLLPFEIGMRSPGTVHRCFRVRFWPRMTSTMAGVSCLNGSHSHPRFIGASFPPTLRSPRMWKPQTACAVSRTIIVPFLLPKIFVAWSCFIKKPLLGWNWKKNDPNGKNKWHLLTKCIKHGCVMHIKQ